MLSWNVKLNYLSCYVVFDEKSVLLVSSVCFQKDQNSFFSFYINGNDRQGDRWGYGLGLECFYTS